jgi:glycosyltransferase involved in cell wall biosynthesis
MSLVYIPENDFKNIGGPTTFIKNLAKYFKESGVDYTTDNHDDAQSILFPINFDTSILKEYKKKDKPIIQRLDGVAPYPWHNFQGIGQLWMKHVYENSWIGPKRQVKYILDMYQINHVYQNYSDLVIFQSEYCKNLCFDAMKPIDSDKYTIIHNGVHSDIFYPLKEKELGDLPTFVMTGRFRRKDMLLPVLDALDLLKEKYKFRLKLIGPLEDKDVEREANQRNYIDYKGPMTTLEIAKELRSSDIYIFASLNAPCPNALLEAVSSGLPIVSYDYGSVLELLNFCPDLIAETKPSYNPFIKSGKHLSAEALMEKLELSLNQFSHYKDLALVHSKDYSFEKCGDKYISAIKKLISGNV